MCLDLGMLMPETPAAFPVEKNFLMDFSVSFLMSQCQFFEAVVDISVKQSEKTAKGLSWFWFVPPPAEAGWAQVGRGGGNGGCGGGWWCLNTGLEAVMEI